MVSVTGGGGTVTMVMEVMSVTHWRDGGADTTVDAVYCYLYSATMYNTLYIVHQPRQCTLDTAAPCTADATSGVCNGP